MYITILASKEKRNILTIKIHREVGRAKDLPAPPYVERNTEARSCNSCCIEKATSITQPVCVFVALSCPACIPHYIVICGLPRYTTFFHIIS